ncbi:hypothetical protein S40288_09945 [Stachybotrys chartarum IBT 40288]|nr:hypothetical protein S40288_09945 [Stachybotrys chartarum IBT 40288]
MATQTAQDFITRLTEAISTVNPLKAPSNFNNLASHCNANLLIIFQTDASIINVLEKLSDSDYTVVIGHLDNVLRGLNYVKSYGFECSIPEDIRFSKRRRTGPDVSTHTMRSLPPLPPPQTDTAILQTAHDSSPDFNPATVGCQWNGATSEAGHTRDHSWHPRLVRASKLPLVFRPRMCDGVEKENDFARITVSYAQDPEQCSLNIEVTRTMVSTLAKELYNKDIKYNEVRMRWIMELQDGTDVAMAGGFELECASESGSQNLLGPLLFVTLQNNPQRLREVAKGQALTRLLILSSNGDATLNKLKVVLDAAMLGKLEQQLTAP